jgi:hypothetical protein
LNEEVGMRRRLLTILLALTLVLILSGIGWAAQVSIDKARTVAQNFLSYCVQAYGPWARTDSPLIKGYIDYSNVFDKKTYPHLPYEKFKIFDKRGNSLEVWAMSEDNRRIFDKTYKSRVYPGGMMFVRGVIVGFDTPTIRVCHRGIKIEVQREGDVIVKTNL